jgi:hypothetical protein
MGIVSEIIAVDRGKPFSQSEYALVVEVCDMFNETADFRGACKPAGVVIGR